MHIEKATSKHIGPILTVIGHAREIMRETGNATQWTNGYPSREIIARDIASGNGFVCVENDAIAGYFYFKYGENTDPTYDVIENGKWLNDKPYGVIHRLAAGKKAKGIAKAAFDFAFSKIENVRVDTHRDNLPMKNFLAKAGFFYCGVIYVADGTPRDAFQKELVNSRLR